MTLYRVERNGGVLRTSDGAHIPINGGNADWKEYLKWLALGNVPDPYVAPLAQTPDEVIDQYFPQTGVARVLFEALFEIANRLQVLESKPPITRAQLRTWLISKLPA